MLNTGKTSSENELESGQICSEGEADDREVVQLVVVVSKGNLGERSLAEEEVA